MQCKCSYWLWPCIAFQSLFGYRIFWNTIDFVRPCLCIWLHSVQRLFTSPLYDFKEPSQCCLCGLFDTNTNDFQSSSPSPPLPPYTRYNFLQLTKRQCKCLCILHAQVKYRLVYDQMRTPIAIKTRISDQDRIPCPFHFWLSTKTNFLLFQNKDTRLNMHRISHCTQIFTYIRTGHAKSERERANRLNVITIKRKTKITTKWHTISDISADVGRLNNGSIFRP